MWAPEHEGVRWGRVEVTAGFLLLMAWLNYTDMQGLLGWTLLACTAHELGHWCAIRMQGGCVSALRLTAVGAEMRTQVPLSYLGELLCALSGPAVNLLLAFFCARLRVTRAFVFSGINLALGLFNLLPTGSLDGGRILYCVLACAVGPHRAEVWKQSVDRVLVILITAIGGWVFWSGGSIMLLLIGVWLSTMFQKSSREKGCKWPSESVKWFVSNREDEK